MNGFATSHVAGSRSTIGDPDAIASCHADEVEGQLLGGGAADVAAQDLVAVGVGG